MSSSCIVVPCFNEANRVDVEAFSRFVDDHPDVYFLFVNDGSGDETGAVLKQLVARRPENVRALDLAHNSGKAEAIRAGTATALEWKSFDYAGFLDADLSAPLDAVLQLRDVLDREPRYAFAMGSRVALLGRTIRRNARRHYLGRVFATAVSLMLKLPVYDTQCGVKLCRAGLVPDVFTEPFVTRWFFDVEILFRILHARGAEKGAQAVIEVPLQEWTEKGDSRLTAFDFVRTPLDLLRIWRHYRGRVSHGRRRS